MVIYIYVYIYIWSPPPPSTDPGIVFPICPGSGGGGGRAPLQNSSSFQKSQNPKKPNPSFGFLETRGICSKSKKTQNSSSFQKSKNPKIPTPVSDFWKLEEFWVFFFEQIPRVSKNPKLGLGFLGFWIFGNSGFGEILLGVLHS